MGKRKCNKLKDTIDKLTIIIGKNKKKIRLSFFCC